jgi:hypothetical protein
MTETLRLRNMRQKQRGKVMEETEGERHTNKDKETYR